MVKRNWGQVDKILKNGLLLFNKIMLDNTIREIFDIKNLQPNWKILEINGRLKNFIYYDEKLIIKKLIQKNNDESIHGSSFIYSEIDYDIILNENLEIIGNKGKIQKLTEASLLRIKPSGKALHVLRNQISLVNWKNNRVLINEYRLNFSNEKNINEFLSKWYLDRTDFEINEFEKYKFLKREVKQKYKSGDIFRVKLYGGKFAYGRIICGLNKFKNYNNIINSELEVDFRGNSLFHDSLQKSIWIDFYQLITNDPNMKKFDLKNIPKTCSIIHNEENVLNRIFEIIDHEEIDINSFDVPMEIDTYYQYLPITQIFKWGPNVILFKPNQMIEELKKQRIPMYYQPIYVSLKESIYLYIESFILGKLSFKSISIYGDLRENQFLDIRKLIGNCIGYDIIRGSYDEFAKKFKLMTKKEILYFAEN